MTTYIALRTIGTDGVTLIDQPTDGRVIATGKDYPAILSTVRHHCVNTYRHRVTHEVRTLSEAQRAGCARTNPDLFAWLKGADVVQRGEYAIPVTAEMLPTYEPADAPIYAEPVAVARTAGVA
jgi:hypothetical protein